MNTLIKLAHKILLYQHLLYYRPSKEVQNSEFIAVSPTLLQKIILKVQCASKSIFVKELQLHSLLIIKIK